MSATRDTPVRRVAPGGACAGRRALPVEAPVSIEINGLGYAVMMATPADLEDFGVGFAASERLIDGADDVVDIEAVEVEAGWLLRLTLDEAKSAAVRERARRRVVDSSCGLCGIENLEQALRPLPTVGRPAAQPAALFAALDRLAERQPLNAATGGAHGAAWCALDGNIIEVREDVGRHNAFDKLIGATLRSGRRLDSGFVLLTSRCSYELVEKAAIARVPLLATISTATTLAVERARGAGLTLASLVRADAFLVTSDPHRWAG